MQLFARFPSRFPAFRGEYALRTDLEAPGLSHIAATVMRLLGYEPPEDYDPPLVV